MFTFRCICSRSGAYVHVQVHMFTFKYILMFTFKCTVSCPSAYFRGQVNAAFSDEI